MENNNTFKVINDEGKEIVCDILFTFDSEETKKSYIVYTDNSKDEAGNIQGLHQSMILKWKIQNWIQLKLNKNGRLLKLYLIHYKKKLRRKHLKLMKEKTSNNLLVICSNETA